MLTRSGTFPWAYVEQTEHVPCIGTDDPSRTHAQSTVAPFTYHQTANERRDTSRIPTWKWSRWAAQTTILDTLLLTSQKSWANDQCLLNAVRNRTNHHDVHYGPRNYLAIVCRPGQCHTCSSKSRIVREMLDCYTRKACYCAWVSTRTWVSTSL